MLDVLFGENLQKKMFIRKIMLENLEVEEEISIAAYFKKEYNLTVKVVDQPLIISKCNGHEIFLPPEFCFIDGVPASIKKDPRKMKQIFN